MADEDPIHTQTQHKKVPHAFTCTAGLSVSLQCALQVATAAHCCKIEMSSFCSPCRPQIIDKGIPEGAMPGIAGRQVQLKDEENVIPGLLNGQGNKVSLLSTLLASLSKSGMWLLSAKVDD